MNLDSGTSPNTHSQKNNLPTENQIEIIELKPCQKNGNLKAFVDVKIDSIIIHDFRIIQQKDQKPWVSVPQLSWRDSSGGLSYKNLVELPKELKSRVEEAILEFYQRHPSSEKSDNNGA